MVMIGLVIGDDVGGVVDDVCGWEVRVWDVFYQVVDVDCWIVDQCDVCID